MKYKMLYLNDPPKWCIVQPSLMCIGYLEVIVTKKKQGFQDMLCDTYVVYKGMIKNNETVMQPQNAENTSQQQVATSENVSSKSVGYHYYDSAQHTTEQ